MCSWCGVVFDLDDIRSSVHPFKTYPFSRLSFVRTVLARKQVGRLVLFGRWGVELNVPSFVHPRFVCFLRLVRLALVWSSWRRSRFVRPVWCCDLIFHLQSLGFTSCSLFLALVDAGVSFTCLAGVLFCSTWMLQFSPVQGLRNLFFRLSLVCKVLARKKVTRIVQPVRCFIKVMIHISSQSQSTSLCACYSCT